MTITDDSRVDELLESIASLTGRSIDIGVIGESGTYKGSDISTLDVARANEFGTDKIPERSFIRASYDRNEDNIKGKIEDFTIQVIEDGADADYFFDVFGQYGADLTQQYLTELSSPPNSPLTIKIKGSSNPLIDTGQLRSSITYEVV